MTNSSVKIFFDGVNEPVLLLMVLIPIGIIIILVLVLQSFGSKDVDEEKFRNFTLANNPSSRKKYYPENVENLCF